MTEHEELLMLRALAAKQALYDAYVESERSLDEIIDLIRNADEWIQAGFSCKISGSSQFIKRLFENKEIQFD